MKIIGLLCVICLANYYYFHNLRKSLLFLFSSSLYYIVMLRLEMPTFLSVVMCVNVGYMVSACYTLDRFVLVNLLSLLYVEVDLIPLPYVFIIGLCLLMVGVYRNIFAFIKRCDQRESLFLGLITLTLSVLFSLIGNMRLDLLDRVIIITIIYTLTIFSYKAIIKYLNKKEESIEAMSQQEYLKRIRHDLNYAISLQSNSLDSLKKVSKDIDELLYGQDSFICVIKQMAQDHHVSLSVIMDEKISLNKQNYQRFIEVYEIILDHCQDSLSLSIEEGNRYLRFRFRFRLSKNIPLNGDDLMVKFDHDYCIYTLILRR